MKKFLIIIVTGLLWCNILPAKILNIENQILLEVPSSHKYIEYDNEEAREAIEEVTDLIEGLEIKIFLVGPNKYVEFEKAILDGEDIMENKYVKSIMKKAEKKRFKDEVQQGKWLISEAKKILKKEKIDFITYALVSNQGLTKLSQEEQSLAGLKDCTEEEFELFNKLNSSFKLKFNIPFIFAVRGKNKSDIINEFQTRLINSDINSEIDISIEQVKRIALLRLEELIDG